MRILYVTNGFPPSGSGGVEVYSYRLALEVRRRGHEVVVFCRESDLKCRDRTLMQTEVDDLPVWRLVNDYKLTRSFEDYFVDRGIEREFERFLKEMQPDIVHFQHVIALSAGLPLVARSLGVPCVLTLHDYWPLCQRVMLVDYRTLRCPGPRQGGDCRRCLFGRLPISGWRWLIRLMGSTSPPFSTVLRRWGENRLLVQPPARSYHQAFSYRYDLFQKVVASVQRILTPSEFVKDTYEVNGYPRGVISVVPLGIELPEQPTAPRPAGPDVRIGFIGWFKPIKGAHVLLEAFQRLPQPNVTLDLYGHFDGRSPYVRQLMARAAGDPRVHFRGPFKAADLERIMGEMSLLAVPSLYHETFSLVTREALARHIPVIASRVGAIQDVIRHGHNGFLFEPGNAAELHAILSAIVDNPTSLVGLTLPGDFELLSTGEHAAILERIYTEVLQKG